MYIEEHPQSSAARKYTHSKENFTENQLRSHPLFASALLFEKSWNECKNPSFLHKAMCIVLDHGSIKVQRWLSTFMA